MLSTTLYAGGGDVGFLSQLAANGIIAGSVYGMVGLGFGLIYATARFFHFAHGAVYVAGAYLAFALLRMAGLPLALVVPLVLTGTALLGASLELLVYRPLRRRRATPRVMLIASLGVFVTVQNVIALAFGADTKVLRDNAAQLGRELFGARFTDVQAAIVMMNLLLCLVVWCGLRLTEWGRYLRAMMDDAELALVVGLPSRRLMLFVFAFGSALAGAAALLVGFDTDLTPSVGFWTVLMAITSFIIGGVGNPTGAVWGGLVVGLIQHMSGALVPAKWERTVVFVVLILFLVLRPQGVAGKTLNRAAV
jgi:branched-chain amino acid transport system permease protein